jgi:hypothetical protein
MRMVALWGDGRRAAGEGDESSGDNSFRWTLGWGLGGHTLADGYILAGRALERSGVGRGNKFKVEYTKHEVR